MLTGEYRRTFPRDWVCLQPVSESRAPRPKHGTEVLVLPQAELDALREEARAEVPEVEEYDPRAICSVQEQITAAAGLRFRPMIDTACGTYWCGVRDEDLPRWKQIGVSDARWFSGATPLAATQSLLAAVQAAAAPCPCKSAVCPLCGEPLPPKPTQHMSTEECMQECPRRWHCCRTTYGKYLVYDAGGEDLCPGVTGETLREAWQNATERFREEAASDD